MPGEKNYEYGGFWVRLIAAIIDGLVITIPFVVLGVIVAMISPVLYGLVQIAQLLVGIGYYIYFEGKEGATPGKKAMGLAVVKTDGTFPVGYETAGIRYIGKIVSGLIIGIGYLMIGFDSKKQGLHDKIANTYVVKRESMK